MSAYTVAGNLAGDPEVKVTPTGRTVAGFTVCHTPRYFDRTANEWRDGETLFLRCSIWGDAAQHVADSLRRGVRVLVTGTLRSRSWETSEGEKRTVVELDADEVGPSLKWATARVQRAERSTGLSSGVDPWATSSASPAPLAAAG